jgi:hypothetical protein
MTMVGYKVSCAFDVHVMMKAMLNLSWVFFMISIKRLGGIKTVTTL